MSDASPISARSSSRAPSTPPGREIHRAVGVSSSVSRMVQTRDNVPTTRRAPGRFLRRWRAGRIDDQWPTRTSSRCSPSTRRVTQAEGSTRGSSGPSSSCSSARDFLFRVERDPEAVPPNTAYRVSDLELATRLSFFLWSSIPDAELLDLAVQGELRRPAELERQVRRMLADPRSSALVSNFAAQWLFLRNLPALTPDPRLFPDFDEGLREAMRLETELFVESIIREDRNVTEFLTADYTFVNERLARHYGIPHVQGSHFRRITVPGGTRGGLLGHASILTVTAYPHRTSPVLRGKWVLENILGTPPPPPPPDVPPLADTPGAAQALSMRERMAQHRLQPHVRRLSRDDGSAGAVARAVRRRWTMARGGRVLRSDRCHGRAPRRHHLRRRGRTQAGRC